MECLDGGASVSVNSTSSYNRVGSTCCYFSYEHNFRECRVIFICTVVLLKSMISLNLKSKYCESFNFMLQFLK